MSMSVPEGAAISSRNLALLSPASSAGSFSASVPGARKDRRSIDRRDRRSIDSTYGAPDTFRSGAGDGGAGGIDFDTFRTELLKMACFPEELAVNATAQIVWKELLKNSSTSLLLTYQDCLDLLAATKKEKSVQKRTEQAEKNKSKDEKSRQQMVASISQLTGASEVAIGGKVCESHGFPAWDTIKIVTPGMWGELGGRRAGAIVHSYTSTMRTFDQRKEADNLLMADGTWVLDYTSGGRDSKSTTSSTATPGKRRVSAIISFDVC
jgi:hypothetical protein